MNKLIDLTGNKYGRLEAVEYLPEDKKWLCQCDCGNTTKATSVALRHGHKKSCGCIRKEQREKLEKSQGTRFNTILGRRNGQLLIVDELEPRILSNGVLQRQVLCQCGNCGNIVEKTFPNFLSSKTKTCGCARRISKEKLTTQLSDYGLEALAVFRWEGNYRVLLRCENGHIYTTDIAYTRTEIFVGCKYCHSLISEKDYEEAAANNNILWTGEVVVRAHELTDWQCPEGHQWRTTYCNIAYNNSGCPECWRIYGRKENRPYCIPTANNPACGDD